MRLFLDICQGLGISAAAGLRPFLPALVVGVLAGQDLGVDFDGTSFAFLESTPWLLGMALGLIVTLLVRGLLEVAPTDAALGAVSIGLGSLMFAGTMEDHGYEPLVGIVLGAGVATLAVVCAQRLAARTRQRLDPEARSALPVFFEGAGLALAGLSVLAPPVGLVAVALLGWLVVGGRRRGDEKYAGLRILK
jgi:hypothetical protein